MVFDVTGENVGNITNAALFVGVILGVAPFPATVVVNVGFPSRVVVPKEPSWDDRNRILAVGNAGKVIQFAVDEIYELLVSDLDGGHGGVKMRRGKRRKNATHARHSVSVELDGTARHIDLQIEGVDEGDSGA